MNNFTNFEDYKKVALSNPDVKEEYDALGPKYALIKATLEARAKANLSQQELADKTGINRADISKLENGKTNPSYNLLCKLAKGMGMKVKIEFIPEDECQHQA